MSESQSNHRRTAADRPLAGQVAIVTGGGRGIGRAIALELAAAGASVVVNYHRSQDDAETVADMCRQLAGRALAVGADVGDKDQVAHLVTAATALGPPRILVNNAGVAWTGLFSETSVDVWERLLRTNLTGTFLCTQAVLPHMLRQGYGRVVNIASIWGMVGGSCEVAYSASKGGVIAMTRALAKELGRTGITVNAVAPGAIASDMTDTLSPQDKAELEAAIPVGHIGEAEDVARCVRFLVSPRASYLTGQVISPNGGLVT
jgi:3-oxoacyl-[acyl-carrier protein] reductase